MAGKETKKNIPSAVETAEENVAKKKVEKTPKKEKDCKAAELMKQLGVGILWKNSKGEYFTEKSLALASEGGKQENIKEYKK